MSLLPAYLPPFVSVFFVPLAISWAALISLDYVVTFILNKTKSDEKKSTKDNVEEKAYGFLYGNGPLPLSDTASLIIGSIMLIVLVPIVGFVVGLSVLWEFIDRGGRGRPQDGVVMSLARYINSSTAKFTANFTKHPEDGFILNVLWFLGGVIPLALFLSLDYTLANGFSLPLCIAYHVFRIGPYFMNFAYTYTLCHKEGHSRVGFYSNPILNFALRFTIRFRNFLKMFTNSTMLRNSFNWWVGLFYGVMPSSFACGHSINHHKYNNGPLDVVSTADKVK